MSGVVWYTNIDHNKRHEEMILVQRYRGNESDYPAYDNYQAIEVSRTQNIPKDYDGAMGVPVTFLTKYNPDQFEIIGMAEDNGRGYSGGVMIDANGNTHATLQNGRNMYKRLFIRNLNPIVLED